MDEPSRDNYMNLHNELVSAKAEIERVNLLWYRTDEQLRSVREQIVEVSQQRDTYRLERDFLISEIEKLFKLTKLDSPMDVSQN